MKSKKDFFFNLLNGNFQTQEDVYKKCESLGMELVGVGAVMVMEIDSIDLYDIRKEETTYKDLQDKIIYKLTLRDDLIAIKFYKSIIIIPIFSYYEVKNDNISIKTLIKFGRSIKEYVEQEIDYINIVIGIGRYYENILNIDRSYKEAKKALVVGKNMSNGILHFDQMRIYKLLTKVEDKNELRIFYNEILYPIKKYDEKNNTNLLGTLEMYFEYNENMNATSKALYIHVNTLKYRLNRIKEILNIDDLDIENKVELYLSLKVMKLLENLIV